MIKDPVKLLKAIEQEVLKTNTDNSERYNKLIQARKDLHNIISDEDRTRAKLIAIRTEMARVEALENGIIPRIL